MADSGWIDATDEGSADINGGAAVTPTDVVAWVVDSANPRAHIVGSTFPHQLRYFGSVTLMSMSDQPDTSQELMVWWTQYLQFEFQAWPVYSYFQPTGDAVTQIGWKLPMGVEMKFRVYW